jgi:hypothetical protein
MIIFLNYASHSKITVLGFLETLSPDMAFAGIIVNNSYQKEVIN